MADVGLRTQRSVADPIVIQLMVEGFKDAVEIGRGGFGVVYRCTQIELDRVVAVKVLTADLEDNRPRFEREQLAMARLTGHPNIVAVLQVGELASGLPFLVMPFHGQGCLQDRIARSGVLPLAAVLRIGVKLAGALESAHRLGVVHRDVKPANILLTDYGEPALCDFGIARVDGAFKTATGLFTGSPAFTAPEVAAGAEPTRASDVYGLGASLFAALTGHAAFERRTGEQVVAQFLRIATESVPNLREQQVPDDVAAVVEATMARDPHNRPSALVLSEQLQQLQARRNWVVDEIAVPGLDLSDRAANQPVASAAMSQANRAGTTRPQTDLAGITPAQGIPVTTPPRGNLPEPLAGLVGRGRELAQVAELVSTSRLVTLTGFGGVGKTTVATQAAHQLGSQFADGVWLVELGDLSDDGLLTDFVAGALGARNQSNLPLLEVLVDFLRPRQLLMVLDNCEHLVDAVAKLVTILLRQCPQLRILATSREMLDIDREAVLSLSPLACPDPSYEPTLRSLAGYDAVELFVARARAAVPGFALTQDNAAAVADICGRLEGLPLALELAAARLRAMSVGHIAEALSDHYTLLSRGRRGAPHRQQTLAGCIGWSYDLCTQAEQQLWARLSVFAASFELEAAHQVCGDGFSAEECLDLLSALVDKSILVRTEHHDTVRFRLLETLRDYGRQRIADGPHHLHVQHHHAVYYQRLVANAKAEWFTARQVHWIERVTDEMPDLREALQFSLQHEPAIALKMAADLRPMWLFHGMLGEGSRWLDLALRATPTEPRVDRIRALVAQADLVSSQDELSAATALISEAQNLLDIVDDPISRGLVNFLDGWVSSYTGETERGMQSCRRSLSATDDIEVQVGSSVLMGWLIMLSGDVDDGLSWFEQALALAERGGDSVLRSLALASVGVGRWRVGEYETAERMLRQGLRISLPINDLWNGAEMLEALAWIAASTHDPRRAAVLLSATAAVSHANGAALPFAAIVGGFHEECERAAREQLSQQDFDAAWNHGSALSFSEAVAYSLKEHHDQ